MNQMALFIGTQYSQNASNSSSFLLNPGICGGRNRCSEIHTQPPAWVTKALF